MPGREIFLRWAAGSVLLCGGGCSSSYGPDPAPLTPERAAALEAERERLRVEQEAEREAALAKEAEFAALERAVQGIESEGGEPSRPLEESEVSQLLLYYCGDCHGAELALPYSDGMYGIEDLALMIESGKILPGDGEGSRLVVRMRMGEGRMPPVNAENPPMPEPSIERIVAFIDALPVPQAEP
jgi:hypothetical protein